MEVNMVQQFAQEFWGCETRSSEKGFIAWRELKDNPKIVVIYWLYTYPEYRGSKGSVELFQWLCLKCQGQGYTHFLAEIDTQYGSPTENLLHYARQGFKIVNAINDRITLQYDL